MKKRFLAVAVASLMAMSLAAVVQVRLRRQQQHRQTDQSLRRQRRRQALTERRSMLSLRDSSISSGKQLRRVQCRQEQI